METKTSVIKELDTNQDTRRIEIGVQLWQQLIIMIRLQTVSFGFIQK